MEDLQGKIRVYVHLPYLLVLLVCLASLPSAISYNNRMNTAPVSAIAPSIPLAMTSTLQATPLANTTNTTTTPNLSGKVRLIVRTTSLSTMAQLQSEGCEVIHELIRATAIACPANLKVPNSEPDALLHILDLSADRQIKADQVWAQGYTGSGVTVAVLDTGVDATHPELKSSIVGGRSFVAYTTSYADDHGHGTHVSGIITSDGIIDAKSKGVAPNANVWMGKVCDSAGNCQETDIASGIEYVVNNNIAKVISISIGGPGTTASNCDSEFLAGEVNWAYNNGVVSVIASGNDGSSSWVDAPACASKAIAVGAVDSSDSLASFSNQGSAMQDHGVAAPGVGIYSTYLSGGYAYMSGTSMATPHVSATIALMLQMNPSLSNSAIRSTIFNSADCLGMKYGSCPNTHIGYGRVDALSAIFTVVIISTVTSTSYVTSTIYTSTSTLTSTIPTLTTIVLVPVTMTSTVQSTPSLTSMLTTTVTSYTGTETSTSTIVVPTTVVLVPSFVTSTVKSTQLLTSTVATTMTNYTATSTVTSPVVVYTTTTVIGTGTTSSSTTTTSSSSTTTTSSSSTTVSSTTTKVSTTSTKPCGRICSGDVSAAPTVAALADPFALLSCLCLLIMPFSRRITQRIQSLARFNSGPRFLSTLSPRKSSWDSSSTHA